MGFASRSFGSAKHNAHKTSSIAYMRSESRERSLTALRWQEIHDPLQREDFSLLNCMNEVGKAKVDFVFATVEKEAIEGLLKLSFRPSVGHQDEFLDWLTIDDHLI